jgi:AcrR family transcriptional regulator
MLINETQPPPRPKLDRRVKRTRKLIQQAFAGLLKEQDFHNITVHDIAERAEVNRATFYLHFEDKYALLAHSVREALQERLEKKLPDTRTLSFASLRLLTVVVAEFMGEFFGHCFPATRNDIQMLVAAQVQKYVFELLLGWITSTKAGTDSGPISAEHAAAALGWLIFGAGFQSQRSEYKQSAEQWADQMLTFLVRDLRGYLGDPG